MDKYITDSFGHRLRVRVCGICISEGKVLMIKHHAIGPNGFLWAPPGGGMQFGSCAHDNLIREFKEETGLDIAVERFLFVHEYLEVPLHAIELFYAVRMTGGILQRGYDPELFDSKQIIKEARWLTWDEIRQEGLSHIHDIFKGIDNLEMLFEINGYHLNKKKSENLDGKSL